MTNSGLMRKNHTWLPSLSRQSIITSIFIIVVKLSLSQNIEDILPSTQYEFSETEIQELEELYRNPIHINTADFSDYSAFFFLSEFEKKSLFAFVQKNKPIKTIYELQYALGIPKEKVLIIAQICSLSYIKKPPSFSELTQHGKHVYINYNSWFPISHKDYNEYTNYTGEPIRTVHRYRFSSHNNLFWGITLKNDMGEQTQHGPLSPKFDYSSAYFQYNTAGRFSTICIGDYELKFGQGLTIWQGGFFGKFMGASPLKNTKLLKYHSSTNEFSYNRGVAVSYSLPSCTVTPFVSHKHISGTISNNTITINETGYHRTKSEIEKRKSILHTNYGSIFSFAKSNLRNDFSIIHHSFSNDTCTLSKSHISWAYLYTNPRVILYGESALDQNTHIALLHGADYSFSEQLHGSILLRKYHEKYESVFANAFSEQSNARDEIGAFIKTEIYIHSHTATIGYDVYYFPEKDISGRQFLCTHKYNSYKNWKCTSSFAYENKYFLKMLRVKYTNYYVWHNLLFKTTYSYGTVKENNNIENGYFLQQDVKYTCKNKFQIACGVIFFNAPYNTRLYAWEQNILYSNYTSQILYNGKKGNLKLHWEVYSKLTLEYNSQFTLYTNTYDLPEYYEAFNSRTKTTHFANIIWQL